MSRVFLSYAREDGTEAEQLAKALEEAGHTVWWDRHIQGGAQFAAEIARALSTADVIVVLWSEASVHSTWVQDEAAEGRDTGRLVPVLLDDSKPPLGFRQFQSTDLRPWRRTRQREQLEPLLNTLGSRDGQLQAPHEAQPSEPRQQKHRPNRLVVTAGAVLFLAVGGWAAVALIGGDAPKAAVPRIGVLADANASPAASLARQLSTDLARQANASGGFALVDAGPGTGDLDYLVKVASAADNAGTQADLNLVLPQSSEIVWATTVERSTASEHELRSPAAAAVALALECLTPFHKRQSRRSDVGMLRMYLSACTRLKEGGPVDEALAQQFRDVAESLPEFPDAWAQLALVEARLAFHFRDNEATEKRYLDLARAHLDRARGIDPDIPDIFLAQASLLPTHQWAERLSALDAGLARNPSSAELHSEKGYTLMEVGRLSEAIDSIRQAVELNPLSPTVRHSYITNLAYAGRIEAAFGALNEAQKVWRDSTLDDAAYRIHFRYGDPGEALRILSRNSGLSRQRSRSDAAARAILAARLDPTAENVNRAVELLNVQFERENADGIDLIQAQASFGRIDDAFETAQSIRDIEEAQLWVESLFRPQTKALRQDPRFIHLAHRLGLVRYWKANEWPDFCYEPQLPYDCKEEAAKLPG